MINFNEIDIAVPGEIKHGDIRAWINKVIVGEGKLEGDINYQFCSDDYLHKINVDFLQHDNLTDIITFPMTNDQHIISGDIFISVERVNENAENLELEFRQELFRVIVHGVLHLIGYKDKTQKQVSLMREKENYYLELIINI